MASTYLTYAQRKIGAGEVPMPEPEWRRRAASLKKARAAVKPEPVTETTDAAVLAVMDALQTDYDTAALLVAGQHRQGMAAPVTDDTNTEDTPTMIAGHGVKSVNTVPSLRKRKATFGERYPKDGAKDRQAIYIRAADAADAASLLSAGGFAVKLNG